MIAVIDNYDSFTYNLVQYLGRLGREIKVFRNDTITTAELKELQPSHIIISPGPGRPEKAGISTLVVLELCKQIPVLGVCLGHQAIGQAFGATVEKAKELKHGKTSSVHHEGAGIFRNLPSPFMATRYHSLVVKSESLPDCLTVTAKTKDGIIMGLQHQEYPIYGVQFHPESILTQCGMQILQNFVQGG